ncbi:FkbM family methyltransferase [Phycobacter sp. K97]|jgi:FkbM family methyltransferase|uniref:FkbM family methyltransferase n=1 Tax=Phycobacter sedimenti TaxID=3133977 RepID=UPI0031204888
MKAEIENGNALSVSQPRLSATASWAEIYEQVKKFPYNGLIDIRFDEETQFVVLCMNDDVISLRYLWTDGTFTEPESLDCWKALAKKSAFTIDVGAYTGFYSLIAASLNRNPVYAYEPISFIHARLATNAMLNNFANLKFENKAVSNKSETIRIALRFGPRLFSSGSSITEEALERAAAALAVDAITLDSQHANDPVELIKIDVESAEMMVLEGAKDILSAKKPVLMMETGKGTHADVVSFLEKMGYSCHPIEASGGAFNYLFYCEDSKLYPEVSSIIAGRD